MSVLSDALRGRWFGPDKRAEFDPLGGASGQRRGHAMTLAGRAAPIENRGSSPEGTHPEEQQLRARWAIAVSVDVTLARKHASALAHSA